MNQKPAIQLIIRSDDDEADPLWDTDTLLSEIARMEHDGTEVTPQNIGKHFDQRIPTRIGLAQARLIVELDQLVYVERAVPVPIDEEGSFLARFREHFAKTPNWETRETSDLPDGERTICSEWVHHSAAFLAVSQKRLHDIEVCEKLTEFALMTKDCPSDAFGTGLFHLIQMSIKIIAADPGNPFLQGALLKLLQIPTIFSDSPGLDYEILNRLAETGERQAEAVASILGYMLMHHEDVDSDYWAAIKRASSHPSILAILTPAQKREQEIEG